MRNTIGAISMTVGGLLFFLAQPVTANFWPGAEEPVERGLRQPNVQERRAAALRIAGLSPSVARTALEQALGDQDPEVRLIGLRTAVAFRMAELAPRALDSLKSREPAERVEGVRLISLEPNEEQYAALESMASDADAGVRREIAVALGRVPKKHESTATSKLLSMLDDSEVSVRIEVAVSLGRLGDPSTVLALAARLSDPEPDVRAQIALALGAIGSETAIPALEVALLDFHDSVVTAVVTALGAMESEDSVLGLVAIFEKSPRKAQGEAAIEALVGLSQFPSARKHVLVFFESSEHRAVLQQVLQRSVPESQSILTECVKTFSSEIAFQCAGALGRHGLGAGDIVAAQEQGRLTPSQALEVLAGVSHRSAIVLALERLSLGPPAEFGVSLDYLASISELPKDAEGPLLEVLTSKGRDATEVARIAQVLGHVVGRGPSKELTALLSATDDTVKHAASLALVRRGVDGLAIEKLLLGEEPVAMGALSGLALGMTRSQAEILIALTEEGRSGRRAAFLSVLFAVPEVIADEATSQLLALYEGARGADKDSVLHPLVRAGRPEVWRKVMADSGRADRLKIAQLSWYQPRATVLARHLVQDADPQVAALAALSLGRNGSAADAKELALLALSSRSHTLRTAAVQGLVFLSERGEKPQVPDALTSEEACSSAHSAFQAQVTRLAASLDRACGGRTLEDVLTRDSDPRRRRLSAALLQKKDPGSPALRTCRFYESRLEVADICTASAPLLVRPKVGTLPYRVQEIWAKDRPLKLTPFSVRAPGSALGVPEIAQFGLRLMTDRSGRVVLPQEAFEPIDPNWFF